MKTRFMVSECMPVIDALKTAGVLGLLMQQAAAFPVMHENENGHGKLQTHCLSSASSEEELPENVQEALRYIQQTTSIINKLKLSIANAESEDALDMIKTFESAKPLLIEQQVRGLEGAVRMAYQAASEQRKHILKSILIDVARVRSAISELNNLISQMTKPVYAFVSNTDRYALKALADHGTEVFNSGRFH